ncbi:MAG TPA: Flp family type IVb pilin [Polyangiales bacterium]|nr:Flp family type IVb pilin [Polyangiales bacterium]
MSRARSYRDQRGAVMVEYAVVLSLVSLGAALAVIALGTQLLELYRAQQAILLAPMP